MRHPVTRPRIRITTWKLYSLCNEMNRSTLRQGGLFKRQRTEVFEDAKMHSIAVRNMSLATFLRKAWLQSRFGPEHTEWGDSKIWFQITRLKLRYAGKELIRMPGETVKDGIITVLPGKKNVNAWLVWARNSRFRPRQLCTASGLHCRASKKSCCTFFGWKYIWYMLMGYDKGHAYFGWKGHLAFSRSGKGRRKSEATYIRLGWSDFLSWAFWAELPEIHRFRLQPEHFLHSKIKTSQQFLDFEDGFSFSWNIQHSLTSNTVVWYM